MNRLLLLLMLASLSLAENYTFLVNKYDKEMELEAEILSKIATASSKKPVTLYIPDISHAEAKVYGRFFSLTPDCNTATFVFINKATATAEASCDSSGKLFFTNNYRRLLADEKFFGAFFWAKSRPNIVFLQHRLLQHNITLPKTYSRYIEELNVQ